MTASRTTPTLWVFVIITGPSRKPESSSQVVPVISPAPFSVNQAPKTASLESLPRGRMAVTPERTGPTPTFSGPAPEIKVVWPTSTPFTSVMAFSGPGVPSNGTPRSRARGLVWATAAVRKNDNKKEKIAAEIQALRRGFGIKVLQDKCRSIKYRASALSYNSYIGGGNGK